MAVSKIWNGSSWVAGVLKTWNGAAWIDKPKFHNGSVWVNLYSDILDTLTITSLSSSRFSTGTATAGCRTLNNGNYERISGTNWVLNGTDEWIDAFNASAAADYECFLSLSGNTGDVSGPALSTWHGMGVTRQWTISSSSGVRSVSGTMTIREIANTSNSVSASVSLSAEGGTS